METVTAGKVELLGPVVSGGTTKPACQTIQMDLDCAYNTMFPILQIDTVIREAF